MIFTYPDSLTAFRYFPVAINLSSIDACCLQSPPNLWMRWRIMYNVSFVVFKQICACSGYKLRPFSCFFKRSKLSSSTDTSRSFFKIKFNQHIKQFSWYLSYSRFPVPHENRLLLTGLHQKCDLSANKYGATNDKLWALSNSIF